MNVQDLFSLKNRVALVTGSATGIGREIARGFTAAGAKVYLTDINDLEGQKVAEELGTTYLRADLNRDEDIQQLATAIQARERVLDVLVNNAGTHSVIKLESLNLADFDLNWRVNARAAVYLSHLLLPLLRQSSAASIINVSSIHDRVPHSESLGYNMSKAALVMFTKAIALELGPEGIRVNAISPGAVETNINETLDNIGRENFQRWIPIGRIADVQEMVGPALFLASEASSYVTGEVLYADGAYSQNLLRYRLTADPKERF